MKKITAILTAVLMLLAAAGHASPVKYGQNDKPVTFFGYVMGDFEGSHTADWISFSSSDPSEITAYDPLISTYAAAYYEGRVYGYNYGYTEDGVLIDFFYVMDCKDHSIEFVEGAGSGGVFVYGMAYNYADNTMYALCDEDHPYIASVDLETGALTEKVEIALGNLLGVQTLAIDGEGNFYLLSFSAVNSVLYRLNVTTGAMTAVMQTNMPCFYGQSMTWDHATDKLYWAHVNERSSVTNGLYEFDLEAGSLSYLGMIGGGMEIMCLFTESAPESAFLRGDINGDGSVDSSDALLALRLAMGTVSSEGLCIEAGDLDGDGSVTSEEALLILRYAMGLSDTL